MTPAPTAELRLRVAAKRTIAEGVVALDLVAADGADLPPWAPGAHIDLRCGEHVRQYSLCGDPADRHYRVAVRREEPGRGGSRFVHDTLAEGDEILGAGPRNNFPLVEAKRYLFLAGGIGITPLLPMMAAALRDGVECRLAYGGRDRASMPFLDELSGQVSLHPQDEVGLLDLDTLVGEPEAGTAVYCCGPEPLLRAIEERAAGWGEATLHVERFSPREGALQGADGRFEVELASTGEVLTVPADRSLLAVLGDAGVPVLSSCEEGTCGTCETGVLAGEIDHRDSLLTPDEQAANDVMFPCVSRARSPRLVLDL
ncbi:PDR/VanB family oxidoreductase [Pseudonocardia sp. WMMC193]|uniref:PDR/VanB family oxidoreductase n=1 Tax=Pseudonocardia sp. WMMC193 TaxID=2911965 RepID=UPI001F1E8E33|nr:PDR/VanB family oxidoreductase [Pseudonocardia sp. WMMC193]MCF7553673.1 PDR/VanB family oxidoreductase [Pseudonocardia sp. WMMC193]